MSKLLSASYIPVTLGTWSKEIFKWLFYLYYSYPLLQSSFIVSICFLYYAITMVSFMLKMVVVHSYMATYMLALFQVCFVSNSKNWQGLLFCYCDGYDLWGSLSFFNGMILYVVGFFQLNSVNPLYSFEIGQNDGIFLLF